MLLNIPLNSLSLSNDAIIDLKQNKPNINIMKSANDLENKLKIKIMLYN